MRQTVLCLVNSAAYSRPYFEQLAKLLEERGFAVVFALDSHLSDFLYANERPIEGGWYFTDFLREQRIGIAPTAIAGALTWASLFPDFDRFSTMGIDAPLRPEAGVAYKDIPALLALFFERVFKAGNLEAVLYEQVSNSFAFAAYQQCKRADVPFCSLCPSRIAGRIMVSLTGGFEDHRTIGDIFRNADAGSISRESYEIATRYIQEIDSQVPDYMKAGGSGQVLAQLSLTKKYVRFEKFRHVYRGWRYRSRQREDSKLAYQHGDPLSLSWAFVKRALWRRLRGPMVSRLYQTQIVDEPFFLYPLHSHPEASTSVMAADFVDELSVICAIAFRLPVTMRLYVKEHPSAVASQPYWFYDQLSRLPNVYLVAAHLPAKELIRNSRGIVCLTSTMGFEGAILNKPVIAMGDVFYGYYPNVRMVRNYSELNAALQWAIEYRSIPEHELVTATAAYVEFGFPGSFGFRESLGDNAALRSVADAVSSRLSRTVEIRGPA